MQRNNPLDRLIREKLSRVAPIPAKGDWERLLDRMGQNSDTEAVDTEKFDQIVREKIPRSAPQALNANWEPLIKRLDRIYWRERQIFKSKVMELIGILLLLLLVDGHFFRHHNSNQVAVNQPRKTSAPKTAAATIPATEQAFNTSLASSKQRPFSNTKGLISQKPGYPADLFPLDNTFTNLINPGFSRIAPLSSLALQYLRPLSASAFELQNSQAEEISLMAAESESFHKTTSEVPSGKILRIKPKSFAALSMFGGADINLIMTDASMSKPSGPVLSDISIPAYVRLAMGYSGGATLSIGRGRSSFSTGLVYTAKQYQARPVFYITGSLSNGFYGEGITNIEHNILTIPLQFRYDILRQQNWIAYTVFGGNMHLVMESNYTVAGENAFRNSDFNPPSSAFDHSGLAKRSVFDLGYSGKGWLQGGGFTNNTFFSAGLSLGLERSFQSGFTFFVQPTYYHSIWHLSREGLGPDQERIHTLSVYTGVRIRLK